MHITIIFWGVHSTLHFYLCGQLHRRGINCTCFVHHTHMMEIVSDKVYTYNFWVYFFIFYYVNHVSNL